jgi:hypothetical protein
MVIDDISDLPRIALLDVSVAVFLERPVLGPVLEPRSARGWTRSE